MVRCSLEKFTPILYNRFPSAEYGMRYPLLSICLMASSADPSYFSSNTYTAYGDGVRLHFVPLFLQCCQLGFSFFKAAAQFGVGGSSFAGIGGILYAFRKG